MLEKYGHESKEVPHESTSYLLRYLRYVGIGYRYVRETPTCS